jgi:hypothetical protein
MNRTINGKNARRAAWKSFTLTRSVANIAAICTDKKTHVETMTRSQLNWSQVVTVHLIRRNHRQDLDGEALIGMTFVAEESTRMEAELDRDRSGQVTAWPATAHRMYFFVTHCGYGATCVLLRCNANQSFDARLTSHNGNIAASSRIGPVQRPRNHSPMRGPAPRRLNSITLR